MLINKAYKFRIYPNNKQKEIINKTHTCARFIYNYYLNKKQTMYKEDKQTMSCYECIKDIPSLYNERPYLKEIDSMSLRCSLFDLDNAYNKFFKEKLGFPKYKSKYNKNSYRTNMIKSTYKGKIYENIKLDLINKEITLPKLKQVKIKGYRNITNIIGRIINATITREKDNRYYVSVVVEESIEIPRFKPNKIIGLDLGIKNLVITSDYEKYENNRVLEKYEKRIKQKQRRLAKKVFNSNNYRKLKNEIARIYRKIKNTRKYIIHNITKMITDNNDIIVTESLKIKNMLKNHTLAKRIEDASLSEIIRQLEYKSKWKGKKMYKIDTYYPSSQICSRCGYKNSELKDLSIREYECPKCKSYLDRDINATENIMYEGIKRYMKEILV